MRSPPSSIACSCRWNSIRRTGIDPFIKTEFPTHPWISFYATQREEELADRDAEFSSAEASLATAEFNSRVSPRLLERQQTRSSSNSPDERFTAISVCSLSIAGKIIGKGGTPLQAGRPFFVNTSENGSAKWKTISIFNPCLNEKRNLFGSKHDNMKERS